MQYCTGSWSYKLYKYFKWITKIQKLISVPLTKVCLCYMLNVNSFHHTGMIINKYRFYFDKQTKHVAKNILNTFLPPTIFVYDCFCHHKCMQIDTVSVHLLNFSFCCLRLLYINCVTFAKEENMTRAQTPTIRLISPLIVIHFYSIIYAIYRQIRLTLFI